MRVRPFRRALTTRLTSHTKKKSVLSKHADVCARASVTREARRATILTPFRKTAIAHKQSEFLLFVKRRHQRAPSGSATLSPLVNARAAMRAIQALQITRREAQSVRNRAPSRLLRKSTLEFGRLTRADRSRLVESVKRG